MEPGTPNDSSKDGNTTATPSDIISSVQRATEINIIPESPTSDLTAVPEVWSVSSEFLKLEDQQRQIDENGVEIMPLDKLTQKIQTHKEKNQSLTSEMIKLKPTSLSELLAQEQEELQKAKAASAQHRTGLVAAAASVVATAAQAPPKLLSNLETDDEEDKNGSDAEFDLDHFIQALNHDPAIVNIGSIPLEELEDAARRDEKLYISNSRYKRFFVKSLKRLQQLEKAAMKRVHQEWDALMTGWRDREKEADKRAFLREMYTDAAFELASRKLHAALSKRKAQVDATYGHLEYGQASGGALASGMKKNKKMDWEACKQPIKITIHRLRGLRDRVPEGRYSLHVSMKERLGGKTMVWSTSVTAAMISANKTLKRGRSKEFGVDTNSVPHGGTYKDADLVFDQHLYTILAAKKDISPGQVFVFELRTTFEDDDVPRTIAYGVFPVCDSGFDTVEGHFKFPMFRGTKYDLQQVTLHSELQNRLTGVTLDVEEDEQPSFYGPNGGAWLCNAYFTVEKLPRVSPAGTSEHEVELVYTARLLAYPKRLDINEENAESKERELFEQLPKANAAVKRMTRKESFVGSAASLHDSVSEEEHFPADRFHFSTRPVYRFSGRLSHHSGDLDFGTKIGYIFRQTWSELGYSRRDGTVADGTTFAMMQQDYGLYLRYILEEFAQHLLMIIVVAWLRIYPHYFLQKLLLEQVFVIPISKYAPWFWTVDLSYQESSVPFVYEALVVFAGPFANLVVFLGLMVIMWLLLSLMKQRLPPSHASSYVQYLVSHKKDVEARNRMLGTHLDTKDVPDDDQTRGIGTRGQLLSRFILLYGLLTVLDPLLILVVDCILGRYVNWQNPTSGSISGFVVISSSNDIPIGDAFKMYWYFQSLFSASAVSTNTSSTGIDAMSLIAGVFVTLLIYGIFICFSLFVVYWYLLNIHMEGRVLDMFHRIQLDEMTENGVPSYFLPHDLEVSMRELAWIVEKAERWRGKHGERRKTTITEYKFTEDDNADTLRSPSSSPMRLDFPPTSHPSNGNVNVNGNLNVHIDIEKGPADALTDNTHTAVHATTHAHAHKVFPTTSSSSFTVDNPSSSLSPAATVHRRQIHAHQRGKKRRPLTSIPDAMASADADTTIHIIITTIQPRTDQSRVYRQFLRLPDGAITEVYERTLINSNNNHHGAHAEDSVPSHTHTGDALDIVHAKRRKNSKKRKTPQRPAAASASVSGSEKDDKTASSENENDNDNDDDDEENDEEEDEEEDDNEDNTSEDEMANAAASAAAAAAASSNTAGATVMTLGKEDVQKMLVPRRRVSQRRLQARSARALARKSLTAAGLGLIGGGEGLVPGSPRSPGSLGSPMSPRVVQLSGVHALNVEPLHESVTHLAALVGGIDEEPEKK